MPGPFDGRGQPPLVPSTISRDSPGNDFSPIGNELPQKLVILVVDFIHRVLAETTSLSFPTLELYHMDLLSSLTIQLAQLRSLGSARFPVRISKEIRRRSAEAGPLWLPIPEPSLQFFSARRPSWFRLLSPPTRLILPQAATCSLDQLRIGVSFGPGGIGFHLLLFLLDLLLLRFLRGYHGQIPQAGFV